MQIGSTTFFFLSLDSLLWYSDWHLLKGDLQNGSQDHPALFLNQSKVNFNCAVCRSLHRVQTPNSQLQISPVTRIYTTAAGGFPPVNYGVQISVAHNYTGSYRLLVRPEGKAWVIRIFSNFTKVYKLLHLFITNFAPEWNRIKMVIWTSKYFSL